MSFNTFIPLPPNPTCHIKWTFPKDQAPDNRGWFSPCGLTIWLKRLNWNPCCLSERYMYMYLRFHSKNAVYPSDKTALQMSDSIFHNDVHVTAAWVYRVWARPRHCTNPAMKFKMSRPKMIKGSICPLKRQAIFATKKMQELKFDANLTINGTIFQ